MEPYPVLGYNTASTAVLDTSAIPDGIADTMVTNTGSLSCLIDNAGNVNIWYTNFRNLNDGGGLSYFPTGQSSLLHWSEANPTVLNVIDDFFTSIHDCDGSNSIQVGSNYFTTATNDGDAYYPGEGFITTPQAGIDASGNLFVVYSCVMENDTTVSGVAALASQNFRDIFGAWSSDGGVTWSDPINISKSWGIEDAFPSIARSVDANLYISWMADAEPGTALQNGDPIAYNGVMFLALDKATFMTLGTAAGNTDACNDNSLPTTPVADFTWAQDATDMCKINFTDISQGNPNTWTWVFGDGATSTAQNPTHTYATPGGLKNVSLVVSNVYGSNSSPTKKVAACIPAGINDVTVNPISIYPNPTSGNVMINLEGVNASNSVITIENAIGQTVSTTTNKNGLSKINLDLSSQANGVYFIKVQTNSGVISQRFVIQK
jgi:Secretion system C-terminal sorting domain/PKD domain